MSYHTYNFMIVEVVISILISRLTFLCVFSFCVAALFAAFRIFSCDLLVEKQRNDLFGFNGFYAVKGDALRPNVAYVFFYFSPITADNRGHQHFFSHGHSSQIPIDLLL